MASNKLSPAAVRALKAYGLDVCIKAYHWNIKLGEGANTIANCMYSNGKIKTTRQADAAINAGREIDDFARAATYGWEMHKKVMAHMPAWLA